LRSGLGQGARPGGAADLVIHDAQGFLFPRPFQNFGDEAGPAEGVDPTGAEDQVNAANILDRSFSSKFGLTVDVEGVGFVFFGVGFALGAVEDIIGGIMDQSAVEPFGFLSEDAWASAVDGHGQVGLALRFVDVCIGGGVDDQVGLVFAYHTSDGVRVCHVNCREVQSDQFAEG